MNFKERVNNILLGEATESKEVDGVMYEVNRASNGFITITSKSGTEFTTTPKGRIEFATIKGKQLSMAHSEEYQDLVDKILNEEVIEESEDVMIDMVKRNVGREGKHPLDQNGRENKSLVVLSVKDFGRFSIMVLWNSMMDQLHIYDMSIRRGEFIKVDFDKASAKYIK